MTALYYLIRMDGRQDGPCDAAQVRAWLADGIVSRYSRARRAHETTWQALREMAEFDADTQPPPVGGDAVLADEEEALPLEAAADDAPLHFLDVRDCVREAWQILMADFAVIAGATLLVTMLVIATSVIPRIGWLIGIVVNNVAMGGLYLLLLARMRGARPSLADIWRRIAPQITTLVAANILQTLAIIGGLIAFIVPGIYLAVGFTFVLPLMVDHGMGAREALRTSRAHVHPHWWRVFGLVLAGAVTVAVVAVITFGIGLAVALPLYFTTLLVAYERLFPEE